MADREKFTSSDAHATFKIATWLLGTWMLVTLPGCLSWSGDVDHYRARLDAAAGLTSEEDAPPPAPFDPAAPLALRAALLQADRDNEAIASAGENYIQALAEKMRLAGTFLPTLSLSPGYNLSHSGRGGTTEQITANLQASANGSLSDFSNQAAAEQTAEQRAWQLLDQREAVLLSVATAYYEVLRFERQIGVLTRSVERQTESLREQTTRLELGSGRDLDVAQSRADLAGTRASLTQARTSQRNARIALARLLGTAPITGPLTEAADLPDLLPAWLPTTAASSEPRTPAHHAADPLQASPEAISAAATGEQPQLAAPAELAALLTTAQTHRQDLQAAARAVEAARLGVDAAIRAYFPSVSINFSYFLLNDPGPNGAWSGGISLNLPIFSAIQIEAGIRAAWSRYRQAGLAELAAQREAESAVRQAFESLHGSQLRRADLEVQVAAATLALTLAEQSFTLGRGSHLERLVAQDNLLSAELDLANERDQARLFTLALLRETGRLAVWMGQTAPSP